jgi:sensor domain CHASE-containing protein
MMMPEGPALVSSQAILTTEGKGPRRGTVIFGRLLDSAETGKLAQMLFPDTLLSKTYTADR